MSEYSMPSYFQTMPVIGKEVAHFSEENAAQIQEVEQEIHEIREAALEAGKSTRLSTNPASGPRCSASRSWWTRDLVPAQQPLQPAGQR